MLALIEEDSTVITKYKFIIKPIADYIEFIMLSTSVVAFLATEKSPSNAHLDSLS